MSIKDLVLDQIARINAKDFAGAAALLAEDCINHAAIPEAQGRAGFASIMAKMATAFPDLHHTVEDTLVDGDKVVVRLTITGTHRGPLGMARLPLEATNKPVNFEQIRVLRVAGGKIVEAWMAQDLLAMFRQLGLAVVPAA